MGSALGLGLQSGFEGLHPLPVPEQNMDLEPVNQEWCPEMLHQGKSLVLWSSEAPRPFLLKSSDPDSTGHTFPWRNLH